MRIADTIATHPKFMKAGELIGTPTGRAEALALYVAAVGYARHFMTDGRIPKDFAMQTGLVSDSEKIANALTHRNVKLWHKAPGGYRIHDFHDWNDKASAIKDKRRAEAARVRSYRKGRT